MKEIKIVRKSSFTLLEIMICLAILSIVGGILVFPLSGMLAHHRFHQGVKQFVIHLREMQALALNYQSDMGMIIYKEGDRFLCKGFTDEPIKLFRPFELQNITALTLDKKKTPTPFKLNIYASGRISPEKVLSFIREEDAIELHFDHSPQFKVKEVSLESS